MKLITSIQEKNNKKTEQKSWHTVDVFMHLQGAHTHLIIDKYLSYVLHLFIFI